MWPCAAEVVSERVRRQIAERQAALAAAEAAPEMSGRAAAELKRALAAELRPGETVTAALRRLRPAPARPASKRGASHAVHDLPAPSGVYRMVRLANGKKCMPCQLRPAPACHRHYLLRHLISSTVPVVSGDWGCDCRPMLCKYSCSDRCPHLFKV